VIKRILRGGGFSLLSQGLVAPRDGLADFFHERLRREGRREGRRERGCGECGEEMMKEAYKEI
jgi:hypothetical protein